MLKLLEFIQQNKNWEELLTVAPYCLKISRDNGYIMFKYNQIESDFTLDIVKEARGIIFREVDWKPVCVPFFKFMNAEEPNSDLDKIDWNTASVQEKVDGSLMKVWYDDGWSISTNGSINAFTTSLQSIFYNNFGDLFLAALPYEFDEFTSLLDKDFTYMFELVSPYNRVVIPYEKTELYALGARNNITLQEYKPEDTELNHRFLIPKRYQLNSYDAVRKIANELPWDEEGFVVCDKNFNRVKIKSLNYLQAHYARNNCVISAERLLDVIRVGEKNEFLIYASDFKDDLEKVENLYNKMINEVKEIREKIKLENFTSRKEYANEILKQPKWIQNLLFIDKDINEAIKETKTIKWVEYMKVYGGLEK